MKKPRKMLGAADSPYILSLMRLIETQSKPTLIRWCVTYAKQNIWWIYEKAYPGDCRPLEALEAANAWLDGHIKLPAAKTKILGCHAAAKEAENQPAAQAAARAVGQAASVIHAPTHSLGMAFYGAAAIAYERVGINETAELYDKLAADECMKMEAALQAMAVDNEPDPAKIKWNC